MDGWRDALQPNLSSHGFLRWAEIAGKQWSCQAHQGGMGSEAGAEQAAANQKQVESSASPPLPVFS